MKLRTGRKLGRTLYIQLGAEPADTDPCIGMVDTSELASVVVNSFNRNAEESRRVNRVPPETTGLEDAYLHVQRVNRYHVGELHKLREELDVVAKSRPAWGAENLAKYGTNKIDEILANVPKRGDR